MSSSLVHRLINTHVAVRGERPKITWTGIVDWIDSQCRRRKSALLATCFGLVVIYGVVDYARYYDWPSFNDASYVRKYVPTDYTVSDPHYYHYRNVVDSWELYRFNTSPEAVAMIAESLRLSSQGTVNNFALIISRPPPHWWHPEQLASAELFAAIDRGPDGRNYELLYAADTGTVYMIRFDG